MTIRTAPLAIVLALVSPMVIAASCPLLAAAGCTQSAGAGCFKKGTRPHAVRRAPQSNDAECQATLEEVLGK
jgi:hypothetical protein